MSKPNAAPIGTRIRRARHAKTVPSTDYADLMRTLGVEPANRKQRRERKATKSR